MSNNNQTPQNNNINYINNNLYNFINNTNYVNNYINPDLIIINYINNINYNSYIHNYNINNIIREFIENSNIPHNIIENKPPYKPTISTEELVAALKRKFPDCDVSYEESWIDDNKIAKKGILINWS